MALVASTHGERCVACAADPHDLPAGAFAQQGENGRWMSLKRHRWPQMQKSGDVVAQSLGAHEMPESAHTVGAGNQQIHLGLGQSSFGLSDKLDLRTRIVGQYFGFNAQLKWALLQTESKALSLSPVYGQSGRGRRWAFLPTLWAVYCDTRPGWPTKPVFTWVWVPVYDVLKVTLRFSDEFVAGQGFGGDWYYSLTMTRAPLVFGHAVEDISDGPSILGGFFAACVSL